jgi:hypothetical protein
MNGLRKCGILLSHEEERSVIIRKCKWIELENIILSELAKLRRPKIVCSPSYADFRSRASAAM